MKPKSTLSFEGAAVLELLAHAKAAPQHTSPYGLTPNPRPDLMLVKDDGIYLMSNGEPGLPGTGTVNKVVHACGYEALPATAGMEERMARYDKVRDAALRPNHKNECLPDRTETSLAELPIKHLRSDLPGRHHR
jgi:hypothetical protein